MTILTLNIGNAPLIVAGLAGRDKIANELLSYGADANIKDNDGYSALTLISTIEGTSLYNFFESI